MIAVELVVAAVGGAVKSLTARWRGLTWLLAAFACVWQASAVQWDETRFEYEPETGRLARKVYPDGKAISYTYYCEGLPKRITQASGKWMERFYDSRLNVTSNAYSSENTPDVHVVPNEFGTPIRVASRERPVGHCRSTVPRRGGQPLTMMGTARSRRWYV